MKKVLSVFFCVLLCFSFFACASDRSGETNESGTIDATGNQLLEHSLRVGFGRVDITPEGSMPIGDPVYGAYKMSTEVLDPLYATCVAFTDETENTVLLFYLDLGGVKSTEILARGKIAKTLGIPADNIMVTATHTHATPRVTEKHAGVMQWDGQKDEWMLEAAQQAMDDRKPAKMYTTSIACESLNFIRHYVMSDGSYAGDQFGSTKDKTYVGHTESPDNMLQLIKFVREGGKDVILVNWQGHPHRANYGNDTVITSDIVGVMREQMEADMDCLFAYFTGASGNINNKSRIPGETITEDYIAHGKALADYAVRASGSFVQRETGPVQILGKKLQAAGKNSEETSTLLLYAFSLGDVAFVMAPYEMFNSQGLAIKAASPFAMTFICNYANGHFGYLPDQWTWETYDSYEEQQSRFAAGTAELATQAHIEMLKELKNTAQ